MLRSSSVASSVKTELGLMRRCIAAASNSHKEEHLGENHGESSQKPENLVSKTDGTDEHPSMEGTGKLHSPFSLRAKAN